MAQGRSMPSTRALVLVALVLFTFWRPLFAGGTLAPDDQLWVSDPFNAAPPAGLTIEVAERDAATIHGWWAGWADDVRSGEIGWWRDVGAGEPFLAQGLPVTHLAYLVLPGWYAPGVVAAITLLLASFGAMRLSDRLGLAPIGGLLAGVGYGFSGLMFTWVGWPHATAIALAPWIVGAALDVRHRPTARRGIGLAALGALQLWCGVFAVSVFTWTGVAAWLAIDGLRRRDRAGVGAVAVAGLLGGLLAAPHLWPRWERWSWADTSHVDTVGDSSAPVLTLISALFGSGFGNESVGVQWFETSSFQLSIGFVGAAVVVAALAAAVTGRVAPAVLAVGGVGIALAYVGGPFSVVVDAIAGDGSLASHARFLLVLALALGAAMGVDALVDPAVSAATVRTRLATRSVQVGLALGGLITLVGFVAWIDLLRDAQGLRAVAAQSIATLAVLGIVLVLVALRVRERLSGTGVAAALVVLAAYELLSFGMPIPTVTDRAERPEATAAHDALTATLGEAGRVAGDHDAFSPSDASRFGIADVRAPGLRSAGEIAGFESVDPSSVLAAVGGGPFEPVVRVRSDADPFRAPLWDLLGVDAWVLPRDATPPGRRIDPQPSTRTSLAAASPLGTIVVPDHGLRAVVLDLRIPAFTTVGLEVQVDDARVVSATVIRRDVDGPIAIPIAGEALPAGAEARVVVTFDTEGRDGEAGTDDGALALGSIGGDPDTELVWTDGALIVARPTERVHWDGPGTPQISRREQRSDRLEVSIDTEQGGVVRSDIVAEPGWSVRLDGRTVEPLVVDGVVLGLEVPAGRHVVAFDYRPPRVGSGALLAVIGVVGALGWAFAESRRSSRVS